MTVPDPQSESSVSQRLRALGAAQWAAAVNHPMVQEIGRGTLPHRKFRRYFEQNICYLEDYARAIGLLIGKAPDLPALRTLERFLGRIVEEEIPANLQFLARLGGDPASPHGTEMYSTTYAYTRHLLFTCAQLGCAEGLTAILPCQWSYGELARPLMAATPADQIYADWIRMFGTTGYDELVDQSTGLLDRLADPADEHQMRILAGVFDRSTGYEVQFWDMAYADPDKETDRLGTDSSAERNGGSDASRALAEKP